MSQKNVCRLHGHVLAQCRCPCANKVTLVDCCEVCQDYETPEDTRTVDELLDEIRYEASAYADAYNGSGEYATFQAIVDLVDKIKAKQQPKESECPYTFAHTSYWCGHDGCRKG